MIYVALALVGCVAVVVLSLTGVLHSRERAHARERDLLLNKVMFLAGKPWQDAPAVENGRRDVPIVDVHRYVAFPETLPDER